MRGVRSTFVVSASSQTTSAASSGAGCQAPAGRVRQRSGQEVDAEVQPAAGLDQLLDLWVGLGGAEPRVELDRDELRDQQPERPSELPDDHLRDERPRPLPGAAELRHVEPVVVCLDEPGQRPALAQRRHVAGRAHLAQGIGGRRHAPVSTII